MNNLLNNKNSPFTTSLTLVMFAAIIGSAVGSTTVYAQQQDMMMSENDITITINPNTGISDACQTSNTCYDTSSVTIPQFSTVTWENTDDIQHSIINGDPAGSGDRTVGSVFGPDFIAPGDSFSFRFTESGTYEYFSVLQPWMTGTITVTPVAGGDPMEKMMEKEEDGDDTMEKEEDGDMMEKEDVMDKEMMENDDDKMMDNGDDIMEKEEMMDKEMMDKDGMMEKENDGTMGDDNMEKDDNENGGGCLIATAAYGTELAPQIQLLREVRDNTLQGTTSGMSFMTGFNQLYYSFSPTISDMQRENPMFKEMVRVMITPMISTLSIMSLANDANSELQILGLGISVILLNLGMYVMVPVGIVYGVLSKRSSRSDK